MADPAAQFDPRAILAALERNGVDYVLIGGLAQVIRGADLTPRGIDICPSVGTGNLDRLTRAARELDATQVDGRDPELTDATVGAEQVISLSTSAGPLAIVGVPAGAPRGFVDLRRAASKEHLGHGVQPLVASTGDLARLAAALHRERDLQRLPQLRRIIELEASRDQIPPPAQRLRQAGHATTSSARRLQR